MNDRPDAELEALFERYAERYMAGDAGTVATMCDAPFLAVRAGTSIHLPSKADVEDHFAELMAAYRKAGADRADIQRIDTQWQGNRAVAATVHWIVRASDDTVIRDFRTTYQLVGPPWTIASYVNHDFVDG